MHLRLGMHAKDRFRCQSFPVTLSETVLARCLSHRLAGQRASGDW